MLVPRRAFLKKSFFKSMNSFSNKDFLKGAALAAFGSVAVGAGAAHATILNCTLGGLCSGTTGIFNISNVMLDGGPYTGQISFDGGSTTGSLGVTFSPGAGSASLPGSYTFDVSLTDPSRFFSSAVTNIFGAGSTTIEGTGISTPASSVSFNAFDITFGTFTTNYEATGTSFTAFGSNTTFTTDVPLPLPVVGAGLAFGFTRKLRKHSKKIA
jgi:hypothetical protein